VCHRLLGDHVKDEDGIRQCPRPVQGRALISCPGQRWAAGEVGDVVEYGLDDIDWNGYEVLLRFPDLPDWEMNREFYFRPGEWAPTTGDIMKVKDEDGKVREVKPRSVVGSQLVGAEPGTVVYVGGLKYELAER
jgi:hypothetical protein